MKTPSPAVLFRALVAAALLAVGFRAVLPERGFTVTVLNVGQGDAILVQCGTYQMLVDGGPDGAVLSGLGRRMPFFDRRLEDVVLSHPHADHYLGLIPVLSRYRVGTVFSSGLDAQDAEYAVFAAAPADARASLHPGDRIRAGDCGWVEVLWADARPPGGNPNDASVMLRVLADDAVPGAAVVLTGDATEKEEGALLRAVSAEALRADALKAGHHGSRTSSSPAFLAAVAPRFVAVSSGAKNAYGHPAKAALDRFAAIGATTYRTDTHGDIRFTLTADGVTVHAQK